MKAVELTLPQWASLKEQLRKDYRPSYILVRERMKKHLGFVDREFRDYDKITGKYKHCICLDFYSEKKYTYFVMKYGSFLELKPGDNRF
jgi:hypothetical protein